MKKFALLIAVENYEDACTSPVPFAENDATALKGCLERECRFDRVRVMGVAEGPEPKPAPRSVAEALENLRAEMSPGDLFLFYFAGHGIEKDGTQYLLLPETPNAMPETGLPVSALARVLKEMRGCRRMLVLDACRNDPVSARGGSDFRQGESMARDIEIVSRGAKSSGGCTGILTACEPGQRAFPWPKKKHGAFTWFLLEGIRGAAWKDGRLTFRQLADYAQEKVTEWSVVTNGPAWRQAPMFLCDGDGADMEMASGGPAGSPGPRKSETGAEKEPVSVTAKGGSVRAPMLPAAAFGAAALAFGALLAVSVLSGSPLCLAPLAGAAFLGSFIGFILSALNFTNAKALCQAEGFLAEGEPLKAKFLLMDMSVLPWHEHRRWALLNRAFAGADLAEAKRAVDEGRLGILDLLPAARHRLSQAFRADFASHLKAMADRMQEEALRDYREGNAEKAEMTVSLFRDWLPGAELEDLKAAVVHDAREAARAGDAEGVRRAFQIFPGDAEVQAELEKAEGAGRRDEHLSAARAAAAAGDIEGAEAILKLFPLDAEFERALRQARKTRAAALLEARALFMRKEYRQALEKTTALRAVPVSAKLGRRAVELGKTALPRLRRQGEPPAFSWCEASGLPCPPHYDFERHFDQCPVCGRWVQQKKVASERYERGKVWSDEHACCCFCARLLPLRPAAETAGLVRIRRAGESPAVPRCEVTGRRSRLEPKDFARHFVQCRLCGRWVQVRQELSEPFDLSARWSLEGACCVFCAKGKAALGSGPKAAAVHGPGEKPGVKRCEVTGAPFRLEDADFGVYFQQCRICGRWAQQERQLSEEYDRAKAWSDALHCCAICAEKAGAPEE